MKRIRLLILLSLCCLSFSAPAQTDSLQYHAMVDDRKYWVDRFERLVKYEDGEYYAKVEGRFYPLEYQRKVDKPKFPLLEFYVTLDNGEKYYLTRVYQAKFARAQGVGDFEDRIRRIMEKGVFVRYEHPETKPFVRDTIFYKDRKYKYKQYAVMATPEGRVISDEEFKSYGGLYQFVKRIHSGMDAMDTVVILPPLRATTIIEKGGNWP